MKALQREQNVLCVLFAIVLYIPPRQIRGRLNRDRGGKKGVRGEEKKEKNELEEKKNCKIMLKTVDQLFLLTQPRQNAGKADVEIKIKVAVFREKQIKKLEVVSAKSFSQRRTEQLKIKRFLGKDELIINIINI